LGFIFYQYLVPALKIICKKEMVKPVKLSDIFKETEELIAIIAKSITTAQKNKG